MDLAEKVAKLSERELKTILGYDVDALRRNIDRARGNIITFEDAIEQEKNNIQHLEDCIAIIRLHEAAKG